MATLCRACGFDNPTGMRFCGNCGTRLEEAAHSGTQGLLPESLGVLMGSELGSRFQEAGLEAVGQRRNVTVLFSDLAGYTDFSQNLDSEDVFEILQQYMRMQAEAVYRYEGMVDKIMGDGLMALFGAPIAHENDCERAIRAAQDMQSEIAEFNHRLKNKYDVEIQMRIGVHAGSVVVGGIGSNLLMDYTAIGDTVNLAYRLQEAALPGTILASDRVYRQTRPQFDYQVIPSLNLKGITRKIDGYQLIGAKAQPGTVRGVEGLHAPMIGRESEFQELDEAIQNLVRHGQGKFVLVTGEAGIGKSRLIAELQTHTNTNALTVLEGQSLTYRRSMTYWIFLDLLRGYMGVSSDMSETMVRERLVTKVRDVFGDRSEDVLPYFEHFLLLKPVDGGIAERIQYLDANQLRQNTFLAIRDLLVAEAGNKPLCMILEDLHWADDGSLDLLRFLIDSVRQSPLMICGITRPFDGGDLGEIVKHAEVRLREKYTTIQLKSLPPEKSAHLLYQLLAIHDLPADLRDEIIQRSAGIPFFLEEILRMLIDEKIIHRENGEWHLNPGTDTSALGVPDNLQALILTRFDHLEKELRRILQVASVIGRRFNVDLLATVVSDLGTENLLQTLAVLTRRGFILPRSEAGDQEYIFRHALTSDAIYSTLLHRDRGDLHGQVGEALEKVYAGRLDEFVDLLARHYSWSPRLDRALHYLILAGWKAGRDYIHSQAREYYQQALEILPQVEHSLEQVLQTRTGLGDVLVFIGEYDEARNHYLEALDAVNRGAPSFFAEQGALYRKVGTTHERHGDFEEALANMETAGSILVDAPDPLPIEKARILNDTGWIHFRRGDYEQAENYLAEALELVEATTQYDVIASIYNRLGGIFFYNDEFDVASNYVRKSLVLREEMGDIGAVARSYNNLGLLFWKLGDWNGALENFKLSLESHTTIGDVEGTIELHGNLGLLQLDRGNVDEARKHLAEFLATAQDIGHNYLVGITYWYLSHLYNMIEEWGGALDYSQRSLEILDEIGAHEPLVDIYTNIGIARLGLGDLTQAQEWGEKALALSDRLSEKTEPSKTENLGRLYRLLGEIAALQGESGSAVQLYRKSETIFTTVGNKVEQGRTLIARAELAASRGERTNARVLLNEARLIFNQLGARLDMEKLEAVLIKVNGY